MAAQQELKTPFVNTMNQFARRKLRDAFQLYGKALPVSVVKVVQSGVYTVKFEIVDPVFTLQQVKVPLFGPEYIRYPIKVGDRGMVVSADASLAPTAGFATGTADLSQVANLESLVFLPIASKAWPAVPGDGKAMVLYGVDGGGVILQDSRSSARTTLTLTKDGVTVNLHGGDKVTITAGGTPSRVVTEAGPSPVLSADA